MPANAGTHAEPLYIYISILFFRGQAVGQEFFRFGLSMVFSELELLGQIASFERRLRGAAQTPRALPYPFRTWIWYVG